MQRSEDFEKAKYVMVKAEEEQQAAGSTGTLKTLDKKRRLEEEARNKVDVGSGVGPQQGQRKLGDPQMILDGCR